MDSGTTFHYTLSRHTYLSNEWIDGVTVELQRTLGKLQIIGTTRGTDNLRPINDW